MDDDVSIKMHTALNLFCDALDKEGIDSVRISKVTQHVLGGMTKRTQTQFNVQLEVTKTIEIVKLFDTTEKIGGF